MKKRVRKDSSISPVDNAILTSTIKALEILKEKGVLDHELNNLIEITHKDMSLGHAVDKADYFCQQIRLRNLKWIGTNKEKEKIAAKFFIHINHIEDLVKVKLPLI